MVSSGGLYQTLLPWAFKFDELGVSNFSNISNFFAAACPSLVSKLANLMNLASIGVSNTISLALLLFSQVISFSISLKLIPSFETKTLTLNQVANKIDFSKLGGIYGINDNQAVGYLVNVRRDILTKQFLNLKTSSNSEYC